MSRYICVAGAIAILGGCASVSQNFTVDRVSLAATLPPSERTVVYKPETEFFSGGIRLHIPWIRVAGCPSGSMNFTAPTPQGAKPSAQQPVAWSLENRLGSGTVAEFLTKDVNESITRPHPLALIRSSIREPSECKLTLSFATPQEIKRLVPPNAEDKELRPLLDLLVSQRLPRTAANEWIDQYDYDAVSRSMNLFPGMRLRVEHVAPATTDANSSYAGSRHPGSLASPVYFSLNSADSEDPTRGSWSTALNKFGVSLTPVAEAQREWLSVSGIGNLLGGARNWRLFFPYSIKPSIALDSGVDPKFGDLVINIDEQFYKRSEDYPGMTLIGTRDRVAMENTLLQIHTFLANSQGRRFDLDTHCRSIAIGDPAPGHCYVFRYRGLIVPEIPVFVEGERIWIEVGTTVRDVFNARVARGLPEYLNAPKANADERSFATGNPAILGAFGKANASSQAGKLELWRSFNGKRAPVKGRSGEKDDPEAVLGVILQTGDEIVWLR